MGLQSAYLSYRETGVDFLGALPEEWGVTRIANVFEERKILNRPDETLLSIDRYRGIIRQCDTGRKVRAPKDRAGYKLIEPNQLGYNILNAFMGSIGISRYRGIVSPAYAVARLRTDQEPWYFHYLLRTGLYQRQFNRFSYGIMYERNRLYYDRFKVIPIPLPPKNDQEKIVSYLRAQDAHIARLIKAKRELIGLLTEQKLGIIDHAVTRGLDASVRLKPSGIEWLGEVPEHWELLPLRRTLRVKSGDMIDASEETENGYPIYGGNGPRGFTKKANCVGPMLLIGRVGAKCGCVHRVEGRFWASEHALRVIPLRKFDLEYFEHLLRWIDFNRFAIRTAQPLINSTIVRSQPCAIPPLNEQQAICRWIADECLPLNEAIERAEGEIKLIREYRDRLIADVVTGQVDVRGWIPGPDDMAADEELAALCDDEETDTDGDDDGDD